MYLLARAQALSGRPHDALVMLQRLAEMGVPSDGDTNEDFSRTRQLPGWPERVGAHRVAWLTRHVAARPATLRSSRHAPAAPPRCPPPPLPHPGAHHRRRRRWKRSDSRPSALRSAASPTTPSRSRFLFGDRLGRKLIVVGEGSNHAVDFVRADSAGFHEISAIEIDDEAWRPLGGQRRARRRRRNAAQAAAGLRPSFEIVPGCRRSRAGHARRSCRHCLPALSSSSMQRARKLLVLRSGGTSLERVMRD